MSSAAEKIVILVRTAYDILQSLHAYVAIYSATMYSAASVLLQVNEALSDNPHEGLLDFSMRSEVEQIVTVGKRITASMAK